MGEHRGQVDDLVEAAFAEGWTTKEAPAHRPRGLGLALVRRLAERSGGRVAVGTGPLGGAEFTVELPEALHRRSAGAPPAGTAGPGAAAAVCGAQAAGAAAPGAAAETAGAAGAAR
ncbi:ATP-binding protein [Streptomyces sp. NPDC001380]|uniref:ATP-binding protein n=1 Tax=Streptomyces sp. NPDC001380 TaxID=3364566 RepID=UPI0036877972